MKKMIYTGLAFALVVVLQSCGSKGWTDDSKASANKVCMMGMEISYPDDAKSICDCYIDNLVKKYPNADFTAEQNTEVMDSCTADAKKKADDEMERKLNESMQNLEDGIEKAGEEIEEAADAVKEKVEEKK